MTARRQWARPPVEWVLAAVLGFACWANMQWMGTHPEISEARARRIAQRHADESLRAVRGTKTDGDGCPAWTFETDCARGGTIRYVVHGLGQLEGYERLGMPAPGPAIDESEVLRRAVAEARRHWGRKAASFPWRVSARRGEWFAYTSPTDPSAGMWELLTRPLVSCVRQVLQIG